MSSPKFFLWFWLVLHTDLDIVDLAIYGVVCQKSDFNGNSDILHSQKLDTLEITTKKFMPKQAGLSKIFWCKKLTHGA
jgi:hypothetical protein